MLPSNPVSVRKIPPCGQRVCCLPPIRNFGAPSDCSAQVLSFAHLATIRRRSDAWQDLCVEVCRQHTVDFIHRCGRTTREKVVSVTPVTYPWLSETNIIGTTTPVCFPHVTTCQRPRCSNACLLHVSRTMPSHISNRLLVVPNPLER